jgi:hypothetical protein
MNQIKEAKDAQTRTFIETYRSSLQGLLIVFWFQKDGVLALFVRTRKQLKTVKRERNS